MKVPKLGNIYRNGVRVMYRDWITKQPITIVEGWELIADDVCDNNPLLINKDDEIALVDKDSKEFLFNKVV